MEPNTKQLRDTIFTKPFEQRFLSWYRSLFSIEEIESSTPLKWVFGATLFSFFVTFKSWILSNDITVKNFNEGGQMCWPWFQNCGELYFLQSLPFGYSQTIWYMGLFGVMLLVVYCMHQKDWVLAHMGLLILFLWKFVVGFILTYSLLGNFDYYHLILAAVLLFIPHKLFFLKVSFISFYTLSATIKIHEGWILGTYFSSLQTGLPIFPDSTIPIWTNLVITMQIAGAWFLLSRKVVFRSLAVVFFVTFHLYSGVLVAYHYPTIVLPTLIIMFVLFYEHQNVPIDKKSVFGWLLLLIMLCLQLISVLIPGDEKMTLEGNQYGMYMFEANHQCISSEIFYFEDGSQKEEVNASALARNRCDPYSRWFYLTQACARSVDPIERISWQFDHSVNGGGFYRIVDVENVCELKYHPFERNEWIKTPREGAELQGFPVKNVYY